MHFYQPVNLGLLNLIACTAVRRHTVLNPTLDPKLRRKIQAARGMDGKDYFEVKYQIHAHYYSAHCEYTLWFQGKNHGSVKVQYV